MIQQKKVGKVAESTACRNLEVGDGVTVDNRRIGVSVCRPIAVVMADAWIQDGC
jgi:hypothetical protein